MSKIAVPGGNGKGSLPYHKRWHSDMIAEVVGLDLRERGALFSLVDLMFVHGGAYPDDVNRISHALNCDPRSWPKLRDTLIKFGKLYVDGDNLRCPLVDKSLKASDQYRAAQAMRGEISAAKRALALEGRRKDAAYRQQGRSEFPRKPLKTLGSDSTLVQPSQRPESRYKEEREEKAPPSSSFGNSDVVAREEVAREVFPRR
jgi:hypothetical protein